MTAPTLVRRAMGAHASNRAQPPIPRTFRPDIQGLRAIAVTLVVLYHAHVPGITGGYVGVDAFFVISGFLITRQLAAEAARTGRVSLLRFYGRRMRRLLPASVIVVVFSLLLARVCLPISQVKSLITDAYYSAFYGINYHLAQQGVEYTNASAPPSALQHFWSLAVEEQFYAFWPLLILVCVLIGRRRYGRPLMIAAICAISLVTFVLSIQITKVNSSMAYFAIHTRAWELGLGALVALCGASLAKVPARGAAMGTWLGLAMVVGSAFYYDDSTPYPGSAALLPVAGVALVIACGSHRVAGSSERLLGHGVAQYVGKVSYAWYLWHWPLLILLPAWSGQTFGWGMNLEVAFLAFWMAVLSYFVENAALRSNWSLRRWVPTGMGLSAATVTVAVGLAVTLPTLIGTGIASSAVLTSSAIEPLQAELAAALTVKDVPANLQPTLEKAATDYSPGHESCFGTLLSTKVQTCVFGDPKGTRTAVLFGDSHANQWLGPLDIDARQSGVKLVLIAKAACSVADLKVYNNDLKRDYRECDTWRPEAVRMAQSLKPNIVIASQADIVPWSTYSDSVVAEATVKTLKELAGSTAKVVFIGDTPSPQTDAVPCLEKHLDDMPLCNYGISKAYVLFPERHGVVGAAVTAAGYGFIDSVHFFCTATGCPTVVGNLLVRRDIGHTTNSYALHLAPLLAPIFEEKT